MRVSNNIIISKKGWLVRRNERVRLVPVVQAVGHILGGRVRARHGVRPVKIDAAHIGVQRQRPGHGRNAHALNGLVIVQAAAEFGGRALAVVRRCPVAHVVGELPVPVIKHGVIRLQVAGR